MGTAITTSYWGWPTDAYFFGDDVLRVGIVVAATRLDR